MANNNLPDFPNVPDLNEMLRQSCEIIANVRGIPYDFNGVLSLENKFTVLFKTVMEMFKANETLIESYKELYEFVKNYFNNLDVQEEINKKIDDLLTDNSFWTKLTAILPFVTPEMFGAKGDGVTNDSAALQKMIDFASENNKECYCMRKTYNLNKELEIKRKISIHGGNCTFKFNGSNGIIFEAENRSRECLLENFTISGIISGKIGISLTNFVNSVIQNVWFYEMNGIGIKMTGENFETKVDMINFNATTFSDNIGIDCESTDIIFSRINGVNIKTFIVNKAVGNIYSNCHAWLYTPAFFANSLFADSQLSALYDNCIVDTYETGFKVNPASSNRFVKCNWIVNTDIYNKLTAGKVPLFIQLTSDSGTAATNTMSECWLSMPSLNTTNWFDSLATIFNRECLIPMQNCFIVNCSDKIYLGTHYSNTKPDSITTKIDIYRSNIYLPIIQISGEALGEQASGALLFTLPEELRPTYSINIVGGCRVAGQKIIKSCNYYIGSNGAVYVTYDDSGTKSNSFFFHFIFCK